MVHFMHLGMLDGIQTATTSNSRAFMTLITYLLFKILKNNFHQFSFWFPYSLLSCPGAIFFCTCPIWKSLSRIVDEKNCIIILLSLGRYYPWPGSERMKPASFFLSLAITQSIDYEVQASLLTLIFWPPCHTLASFFLN